MVMESELFWASPFPIFALLVMPFFALKENICFDLGFQDPKTTWNAYKTRENVTTPQLAIGLKLGQKSL